MALLLIALAVGSGADALAQDTPREAVVVGVLRDWPPYYAVDDDGEPTGFAVDTMKAVGRRADLEISYRSFDDFPDLTVALRRGEVDVIPNFGITAARDREFDFSSPLQVFDVTLFVRDDTTGVQRLDDLVGRPVGVVASNVGVEIAAEHGGLQPVVYDDVRTALYDLLAGRVDGLIYPRPIILALARSARFEDDIQAVETSFREVKRGIAVRAGDPLMQRIAPAVDQLAASDEYVSIYHRWFGVNQPFWTAGRVAAALGACLMLGLLVFFWSRSRWRLRHDDAEKERRRAEKQREATRGRLRGLLDQASDGIFIANPEGAFIEVNRRGCEMTGYDRKDIIGAPLTKLLDPGEIDSRPLEIGELRRGRVTLSERTFRRADGSTFPGEISGTILADGSYQGIVRDVSERHDAEEAIRARDAKLQQAQKMEAIGRLAGGIAHDFNNLLTIIIGNGTVLANRLDDRPHELLEEMLEAASRAAELTRQLLAYSRQQVVRPEPVDVSAALKQSKRLLRRIVGDHVVLTTQAAEDACVVLMARTHLEQIFMNLAVNALDAMPEGGELAFRSTVEADADGSEWVVLEVSDTGHGMDEETRTHVFEPFYTTKDVAQGTGLGLATVHSIVEQCGGQLTVESAPGEGATFRIRLPRHARAAPDEEATADEDTEEMAGQGATILVVDDEPAVRKLAVRILERRGYQVEVANGGGQAVELCEGGLDIALVVTDTVMPGVGGIELAERLGVLRPALPVLFISGHTRQSLNGALAAPDRAFLAKPFTPTQLVASVEALLKRASREPV